MGSQNSVKKSRDLAKATKKRKVVEASDEWLGFTVYFRYRFIDDAKAGYMNELHYGHRVVDADNIKAAIDMVMVQEKAAMVGHTGDRGTVEFVYATNGVDPDEGLWIWECAPEAES